MSDDGYIWEEASVTYPDWKGTAQLDKSLTKPGIAELIGFDRDDWMVIGLDIGGGEHGHDLRVIAIPRDLFPDGGDVLPKIAAANNGELHATEFLVLDVDPYEILKKISHVFDFRLRVSRLVDAGIPVRIVAHGDIPTQEEF